ncbi:hypothetical protein [Nonomuraea sp. NPDC005650]|uniref:hypothetical protein n=1 Tax=Nonomuraea sp. NPDC005650 TaxID=3157045 RepID=UPI00339DB2F2
MDAIDTLEFGEGFAPLTEDADMFFGAAHIHGVEAIKAFFVKINAPLIITHEVQEFWIAGEGVGGPEKESSARGSFWSCPGCWICRAGEAFLALLCVPDQRFCAETRHNSFS